MTRGPRVAGVDGCPGGWVVVTTGVSRPSAATVTVIPSLDPLIPAPAEADPRDEPERIEVIAIDMPIGLPAQGQRACDRQARARLGPRRSSVFPTPVRAVLGSVSYAEALARSRAVDGRGLSKQAYFLLPKIAELDARLGGTPDPRVVECHPESVFVTLAGAPLTTTKRTAAGREVRAALLRPHFADLDQHLTDPDAPWRHQARPDDVLDAFAAAEAARRHRRGRALVLGDGAIDERGRPMQIIA